MNSPGRRLNFFSPSTTAPDSIWPVAVEGATPQRRAKGGGKKQDVAESTAQGQRQICPAVQKHAPPRRRASLSPSRLALSDFSISRDLRGPRGSKGRLNFLKIHLPACEEASSGSEVTRRVSAREGPAETETTGRQVLCYT